MSLLDGTLGIQQIASDAAVDPIPSRDTLHLLGNVALEDDPENGETRVTLPSGDTVAPLTATLEVTGDVGALDGVGLDAADVVRLDATAGDKFLRSMVPPTTDGDPRKTLVLLAGGPLHLTHLDADPSANANGKWVSPFGLTYVLRANSSIDVLYDSTSHVWRLIP